VTGLAFLSVDAAAKGGDDRPIAMDAPSPVVVDGDDARLRQVVANLLNNALEHTPPGTPVTVRVGAHGGRAHLSVLDEGPGLPPDDAAKIFDRFYRVDAARTRSKGGAGLGLSIVKAIVEAHDGTVLLESAPGHGARFIVDLPEASANGA